MLDLDRLFASYLKLTVHLLVHIDQKYTLFCTQFSALNTGDRILGHQNFEIFKDYRPSDPSRRRGVKASFGCRRLLFSNLLATSIFIETPDFVIWRFIISRFHCDIAHCKQPLYSSCSWERQPCCVKTSLNRDLQSHSKHGFIYRQANITLHTWQITTQSHLLWGTGELLTAFDPEE